MEEDVVPIAPGIELDVHYERIRRNGLKIPLSSLQYRVLLLLVEHRGQVLSQEDIQQAWEPEVRPSAYCVQCAVRRLRQKLEDRPHAPEIIVSVRGRGYMIAG